MPAKHAALIVAIALACGAIGGYTSASLVKRNVDNAVVIVKEVRFVDAQSRHDVSIELRGISRPCLVLKDSTGRLLYDLPP
jgi:hypothetical protein